LMCLIMKLTSLHI